MPTATAPITIPTLSSPLEIFSVIISAITIPERFAEAIIERFIPPESIGTIIAIVRSPIPGSW